MEWDKGGAGLWICDRPLARAPGLGDRGAAAAAPQAPPRPRALPEAAGADAAEPSHRSGRGRARIARA